MRPPHSSHTGELATSTHSAELDVADGATKDSFDALLAEASREALDGVEQKRATTAALRELERRYRDSEKLTETNRALMGEFDFDAVTAIICRTARALLGADGATFVLRESERVRYVQEDAVAPLWKGQDFSIGACVSGWAISRGETAVIPDVYTDARVPVAAYRPTFVKAMVMVPIGPGIKIASLGVYWAKPYHASPYDLELLESLASAADLALSAVRSYQEACHARAEAERANQLKDEFLATISHELRSPLNSIVGFSELLLLDPAADAVPSVRRAAGKILRNAQAQARLISDLLDLSRLQAGTLALERTPCDLVSLVVDAVDSVRAMATEKGVALAVAPGTTPGPLMIEADAVRLRQVLWNLLDNAIKFTAEGGTISVRLPAGTSAAFEVADTGQGIEADFLPHVFDRFRQADGGLTRVHGGMGVGLALVKQLVEMHDGKVSVSSDGLGRGARFRVDLPRPASTPGRAVSLAPRAQTALGGIRVLVVDDSEDSLEMLALLLEQEGALVVCATSGADALRHAGGQDFDLIISDISMPEMDGYQLIQRLREHARHAQTPAVALTGFARPEDQARAHEAGFTAHMSKPIDFAKTVKLVRSALRL